MESVIDDIYLEICKHLDHISLRELAQVNHRSLKLLDPLLMYETYIGPHITVQYSIIYYQRLSWKTIIRGRGRLNVNDLCVLDITCYHTGIMTMLSFSYIDSYVVAMEKDTVIYHVQQKCNDITTLNVLTPGKAHDIKDYINMLYDSNNTSWVLVDQLTMDDTSHGESLSDYLTSLY